VKVFFDSTVWCGAILKPIGINARLLDLAARGGPLAVSSIQGTCGIT
jgi:hypothetical protein